MAYVAGRLRWQSEQLETLSTSRRQISRFMLEVFNTIEEAVLTTDQSGTVLSANAAAARMFGASRRALVEKHGGRYIAQNPQVTRLEGNGDAPSVCVIIEFPDRASAEAWYNDADYAPWLQARMSGAHGDVYIFDGL